MRMIEILVFAALTGYLFFRLWTVLGTRTGYEKQREFHAQPTDDDASIIVVEQKEAQQDSHQVQAAKWASVYEKIKQLDPQFDIDIFLTNVRKAYVIIVESFAQGDHEILKNLLKPTVYDSFSMVIEKRKTKNRVIDLSVKEVTDSEILDMSLNKSVAFIKISFTTEQLIITRDEDGHNLDNPSELTQTIKNTWVFERDLVQKDPRWLLAATENHAE